MSDTLAGLPVPRYKIGDHVWFPMTEQKTSQHPCPDCHDTKVWSCTSPAGLEGTIACPRCVPAYRISGADLPTLNYVHALPLVRRLTIGSVRIDTGAQDTVCYMCHETGIGSGSVYREALLFPDEESAKVRAAQMADEKTQSHAAQPKAMMAAILGKMPVQVASLAAMEARHKEFYTQRERLIELCTSIIEPNENDSDRPQSFDTLVEHIRDEYESAMRSSVSSPGLLAKIEALMKELKQTYPLLVETRMDDILGLLADLRAPEAV
jgi:hypothetical protein